MIQVEFNAMNIVAVLVVGHVLNTFGSWLIHYLQHQRLFSVDFHRIHFRAHHDVTLKHSDPHAYWRWVVIGYVQWLVMIALVLLLYFVLFTPWAAAIAAVEGLLMGIFMYYYHREYNKARSWLDRFEWFGRGRVLHNIHHGCLEGFDRSGNYAIGGPLTGLLVDRVFGTFRMEADSPDEVRSASTDESPSSLD